MVESDMQIMNDEIETRARAATLDRLAETTVRVYLDPVPNRSTLRSMLKSAGIPCFKANPSAHRGGGTVYYSVAATEKWLRARFTPGGAR